MAGRYGSAYPLILTLEGGLVVRSRHLDSSLPWDDTTLPIVECAACREAHPLDGTCADCGSHLCAACNDHAKPCPVCGARLAA